MKLRTLSFVVAAALLAGPVQADDAPYAGQQGRSIKALSDDDIAALRKGEGMGMAKAAELNGYPGPARATARLGARVDGSTAPRRTGDFQSHECRRQAARRRTDSAGTDPRPALCQRLAAPTATIAELQGHLRLVHLAAHLETRALLDTNQIARYQQLRGYGEPNAPVQHHHHG